MRGGGLPGRGFTVTVLVTIPPELRQIHQPRQLAGVPERARRHQHRIGQPQRAQADRERRLGSYHKTISAGNTGPSRQTRA